MIRKYSRVRRLVFVDSCSSTRCGSASTRDEHSDNLRQSITSCRNETVNTRAANTSPGIDEDCLSVRREWRRSRNERRTRVPELTKIA